MKNVLKNHKYLLVLLLFFVSLSVTVSSGCFENEDVVKVSFEDTEILNEVKSDSVAFKVGVYSMYSPRTAIDYYDDFFDYLSESSEVDFELVQRDDPAELLYLLESNHLDAVFIRGHDYRKGHNDFGMELVSIPVLHGDIYYYSYVIARSGVALNTNFAKDCFVKADPEKLVYALNKLIDNALKFSPKGGIVEVGSLLNNSSVTIYVKDSGPGISKDDTLKIFDKFYQVDGSSTRRYGGNGLGLAIAKKIVDKHKANLLVDSIPDVGSTFYIEIPYFDSKTAVFPNLHLKENVAPKVSLYST